MLRSAGLIAKHDESAAFAEEVDALGRTRRARGFDWAGFAVSSKGVFLEGVEVAFIVLTLGATSDGYAAPILGAGAALLLVVAAGAALRQPLTRVPENTLKYAVGAMLVTFGVYWRYRCAEPARRSVAGTTTMPRSTRNDPLVKLAGDRGDPLVVGVVVQDDHRPGLRDRSQRYCWLDAGNAAAMPA